MAAYGQLALIASDHNDWRTCDVNVETALDLIGESGLQEYWMGSFAHLAKGRLLVKQRKPSEAQAEFTRAITLARRGVGVVGMAYVLVTVAEARRELGDRRSAVELVREARELSANARRPRDRRAALARQSRAQPSARLRATGVAPSRSRGADRP